MVKRKWLWGKRASEKISGEAESSGSMSSQSEKCSDDQEASKESPSNTRSPEVTSKATESDINAEESNENIKSLTHELSDAPIGDDGSKDSLSKENESENFVHNDPQELSDAPVDDGSKNSFLKENASDMSVDNDTRPEEITLEAITSNKDDNGRLKLLTEKLSAALLNVSLKDDLVKQHSKVAEEAVAGWEKAENEATTLKQQLEAAVQQKSEVEARVSHLDEALKECVRQLRLARDEQERKINQAVAEKTNTLELAKTKLENQLAELQSLVETSRVNTQELERENLALRQQLQTQSEELEIMTIERDLSTTAAESASKQHLESIKKVAKLEAECRKLKSLSRTSSLSNNNNDPKSSTAGASALIAELDQFKSEKLGDRNLHSSPSSMEIDLMDDFLEMERLVALPDSKPQANTVSPEEELSKLRNELESMIHRTVELEEKREKVEAEKDELAMALAQTQSCLEKTQVELIETQMRVEQLDTDLRAVSESEDFYKAQRDLIREEAKLMASQIKALRAEVERERALSAERSMRCEELEDELSRKKEELESSQQDTVSEGELKMKEMALAETQDCLEKAQAQLREAEMKVEELEKELNKANEEKKSLESELDSVRTEVKTMVIEISSLKEQVQKEQVLVEELSAKCGDLENALHQKRQELLEAQLKARSNNEVKIKQEDLAAAAGKLADCQKTIASLGSQLKSLSTLEDFLIDTAGIPGFAPPAPLMARRTTNHSDEPWKLHSNHTFLPEKEYEPPPLRNSPERFSPLASLNGSPENSSSRESPVSSSSSTTSSAFFVNHPGFERRGNGFAKYFFSE